MHEGHRKRLRERFRQEGLDSFAPHEVLELLLCYGRARGDVNPLAHTLLDTFGSLKGVLEATPAQLMSVPGIGEESATLIAMTVPLFRRYMLCQCEERSTISTTAEAERYCQALLAGLRTERFVAVCLDSRHTVLAVRKLADGTLHEVPAYPRLVAETALYQNAAALVLCHNHPSGDCTPSQADVSMTLQLQKLLASLEVRLLDHVVVGNGSTWSMAAHRQIAINSGTAE